jgi:hypothetical protein
MPGIRRPDAPGRWMMRRKYFPLLAPVWLAACSPNDIAREAELAAVYESLLDDYCCLDEVILMEVTDSAGLQPRDEMDEELMRGFSAEVREAVADLATRGSDVRELPDSVQAAARQTRVPADSVVALLGRIQRERIGRLPNQASVVLLTTAGFSQNRKLAVVRITEVCGHQCGGITLRAIRRHPAGWVPAERVWSAVF